MKQFDEAFRLLEQIECLLKLLLTQMDEVDRPEILLTIILEKTNSLRQSLEESMKKEVSN